MLGDSPERDYAEKLSSFERFAAVELEGALDALEIRPRERVLDLGCGTGWASRSLRERGARVVSADLSLPHARASACGVRGSVMVADGARLPFAPASLDGVWASNVVHHLTDPAAALAALRPLLRPEGWVALAQSAILPELFFAWDYHFDARLRAACHRYYRDRYGLDEAATAATPRLVGLVREAGFGDVTARTHVVERVPPLSTADRAYLMSVADGYWRGKVEPYLEDEDRERLARWCDPDSAELWLDREDFHHVQTFTVVRGWR